MYPTAGKCHVADFGAVTASLPWLGSAPPFASHRTPSPPENGASNRRASRLGLPPGHPLRLIRADAGNSRQQQGADPWNQVFPAGPTQLTDL